MRRHKGAGWAESLPKDLHELPIILCQATEERIIAAARLKAEHPISYADAFAGALAQELDATLVTGDPEFKSLEPDVTVMWLPTK